MKKVMLASGLMLAAPLAAADVLGVHVGVGQWQSDYSGPLGDQNRAIDIEELGLKDSDNNFFYIAFEHPIPVLPNARIQHTDLSSRQSAWISQSFTLDGETFVGGDNVATDVDLTHTDYTLYYELLDNWVNLDLGITARQFDGYVQAEGTFNSQHVDLDEVIPLVYGKAQFDLPFTGLYVGVQANIISYDDNDLSDITANIGYRFIDSILDLGVELGYRQMALDINEDVTADVDIKGPYAALTLHF